MKAKFAANEKEGRLTSLVPKKGLEPSCLATHAPETCVSTTPIAIGATTHAYLSLSLSIMPGYLAKFCI